MAVSGLNVAFNVACYIWQEDSSQGKKSVFQRLAGVRNSSAVQDRLSRPSPTGLDSRPIKPAVKRPKDARELLMETVAAKVILSQACWWNRKEKPMCFGMNEGNLMIIPSSPFSPCQHAACQPAVLMLYSQSMAGGANILLITGGGQCSVSHLACLAQAATCF